MASHGVTANFPPCLAVFYWCLCVSGVEGREEGQCVGAEGGERLLCLPDSEILSFRLHFCRKFDCGAIFVETTRIHNKEDPHLKGPDNSGRLRGMQPDLK